ncbi:MAG: hypothetical protein ACR2HA_08580 [Nocardioides sp.]
MTTAPEAPASAVQPGSKAAVKLPREEDPRNPNHRLAAFFD